MKKIRSAIYTRKSAEEGLEQEFNSLDAQREACAAYVASHKAEGWVLLPTVYEDAGLSGGTLERPGLQRLLADIDAGLVEQIVVYKVDRLTRSLSDFAKLVERLEVAGTKLPRPDQHPLQTGSYRAFDIGNDVITDHDKLRHRKTKRPCCCFEERHTRLADSHGLLP